MFCETITSDLTVSLRSTENVITLWKNVAGTGTRVKEVSWPNILDQWYVWRIEVVGWNFRVFIDGVEIISWTDLTGHDFTSGKVGLATYATHAHFDDVEISASPPLHSAYSLNVRAGVTQIVITCTWSGSGNITIANLTRSSTEIYYESDMSIYEKTRVSVDGTTSIFNIKRATLLITAPTSSEIWILYLSLSSVTAYQVSVETN